MIPYFNQLFNRKEKLFLLVTFHKKKIALKISPVLKEKINPISAKRIFNHLYINLFAYFTGSKDAFLFFENVAFF